MYKVSHRKARFVVKKWISRQVVGGHDPTDHGVLEVVENWDTSRDFGLMRALVCIHKHIRWGTLPFATNGITDVLFYCPVLKIKFRVLADRQR